MQTVIITGGTKGIGAEIALRFLEAGYNVLIGARNKSDLAEKNHEKLKFQKMDVRIESEHEDLIKRALDWTESVHCYINCAGFSRWSSIVDVEENF